MTTHFSGSYPADDIQFLLSAVKVDYVSVEEKEHLIQSGEKHYSDMLSEETAPSDMHLKLYQQALNNFGSRMAKEVNALAQGIARQISTRPIVLVSLVRAGIPLGVCLLHALRDMNIEAIHYGVSIIRDRGLDMYALQLIIARHGSEGIVFVDGWTGKGAISSELEKSLKHCPELGSPPRLAVLADPGGCAWLSASYDDWLMPFGILGAPISGLVSRSLWSENQLHGTMFCEHLTRFDLSVSFVHHIDTLRHKIEETVSSAVPDAELRNKFRQLSQRVVADLANAYQVDSINRIKPGIAEATRAVMRRVPDHVLVSDMTDPDVALLVHLARQLNITIEEVGDKIGIYRAVTIIKKVS